MNMMSNGAMFAAAAVVAAAPSSLNVKQRSSSKSCHLAARAARVATSGNGAFCRSRSRSRSSSRVGATNIARKQQRGEDAAVDDGEGERQKQAAVPAPPPAKLFRPSLWGDFFLSHTTPLASSGNQAWMLERARELKEQVDKMIAASSSSTCSLLDRLQLIDSLERLCLDHLFQDEINAVLAQASIADVSNCDLQTVALWFYLLRRHGYKVAPDVFVKFRDADGNFFAANDDDARGVLNLYNAAYLRTHGEAILDEAVAFTTRRLESSMLPCTVEGSLVRDIERALDIPFPRRVRIYEAKHYISAYEREAATANEMIITELAKLNSNLMQLHHQQELKIITRWWKDLKLQSTLSFARDRVVECYFWILGAYYEPVYSLGRIILTKVLAIVSILDDIYDVYGTSEECELFTKCMESWDRKAAHLLPDYMEFALGKILDTYQSMEDDLAPEEKYRMSYVRNFTVDLVRAYLKEVKWREEGYVPATVDEHLQVSARSGACHLLSCTSFVGMGDIAARESFDWVSGMPRIVKALCVILRLSDDLMSYEREQSASHVASTIDSCMKEHNVPIEMAREKIHELIEESWKDFNGEWLESANTQQRQLLERIFNLTRTMEFIYKHDDAYTNCHTIKDTIHSIFVEMF